MAASCLWTDSARWLHAPYCRFDVFREALETGLEPWKIPGETIVTAKLTRHGFLRAAYAAPVTEAPAATDDAMKMPAPEAVGIEFMNW